MSVKLGLSGTTAILDLHGRQAEQGKQRFNQCISRKHIHVSAENLDAILDLLAVNSVANVRWKEEKTAMV